jgi:hypothetical protein
MTRFVLVVVILRSSVVEYATKDLSVGPTERLFARRPTRIALRVTRMCP